jgi:drug/metabolite transporter (DMT)-like permease
VVLWGFTAILGKLITLRALSLVWWRMTIVAVALLLLPRVWRGLSGLPWRLIAIYGGIGALVAAHWLTFYGSIKVSNASVAATCMALTPVFIAFVEPILVRRRFDARELLFAVAIIPGVALVVGGTPDGMRLGIAIGALSAFFVAVFSSLNKRYIEHVDSLTVTAIEMAAGAVFLVAASPLLSIFGSLFVMPNPHDALLLLALAIGCTLFPFALSLIALRQLSAFTTSLAVNMEPVYSIALAVILLGEQRELEPRFYLGVAIIMAVVFSHPLLIRRSPTGITDGVAAAGQPGRDTSG